MPTANSSASKEVVTAALLVIGSKILSGRTKDQNIGYIAEYLTAVGIDLKEVRVVGDKERDRRSHARKPCSRFDLQRGPTTNVVLRAPDAPKLTQAKREVEEILERVRRAHPKSGLSFALSRRKQGFESPRERQ